VADAIGLLPVLQHANKQPQQLVRAVSPGLLCAYLPTGNNLVEVNSSTFGVPIAVPTTGVSVHGRRVEYNGTDEYTQFTKLGKGISFANLLNGLSFTIALFGRFPSKGPGGHVFFSFGASSSDTPKLTFGHLADETLQWRFRGDVGDLNQATGTILLDSGDTFRVLHFVCEPSETQTMYIDGVSDSTVSANISGDWDVINQMAFGCNWESSAAEFWLGGFFGAYIYDRPLLLSEIRADVVNFWRHYRQLRLISTGIEPAAAAEPVSAWYMPPQLSVKSTHM